MSAEPAAWGTTANTSVESLGVYLPEREVTTRTVLNGCRRRPRVPLERMTGIATRRMAGDGEFSVDLAKAAVARCLAQSRHHPSAIDLVVAANISKQDAPLNYNIEPTTATVLRKHFGLHGAAAFDLGNACAGVFTAILVVDELIRRGDIRRALVVSGEYITHLTATAQRELEGSHDQRLACLTLGDAGVCLLLEQGTGFEFLDLYTVPEHADLCTAHAAETYGAIMFTDSVALARAALRDIVAHFHALMTGGRVVDDPLYYIPHQTSSNSIKEATRLMNRRFGRKMCHTGNMVDNLKHRGNTATTSHWVALKDLIDGTAVRPGQRVMFSIQASGITIGVAQYRVGEFAAGANGRGAPPPAPAAPAPAPEPRVGAGAAGDYYRAIPAGERVRIAAAATCRPAGEGTGGSVALAARAAARVLASGAAPDLALLVYSGVYREAFVSEPALATLVAREMGLKGSCADAGTRQLLAFDLMNGPPGVLMACQVAGRLLLSRGGTGVVATSEYGETPVAGQPPLAAASAGSALRLERSGDATGFRSFYFASRPEHLERYHAYAQTDTSGPPRLRVVSDPRLQDYYLDALAAGVGALLREEQRTLDDFAVILPPQISPRFLARLAAALELDPARLVACGTEDLFTSAAAAGWEAIPARAAQPGALGLFLAVGPGIEVACASYRF